MHALGRSDAVWVATFVRGANFVCPHATRVDDRLGGNSEFITLGRAHDRAVRDAVRVVGDLDDGTSVDDRCSEVCCGASKRQCTDASRPRWRRNRGSPMTAFLQGMVGKWACAAFARSRRCNLPIRQPPVTSYIHSALPSARAIFFEMTPSFVRIGIMNGITCTRCGALRNMRWRSCSAS